VTLKGQLLPFISEARAIFSSRGASIDGNNVAFIGVVGMTSTSTVCKEILGCAVLGLEGGEIMAILEVAMLGKLPYTALRDAVFAHPTLAESLNNLFSTLDQ
jgi:pyruvate/2-oxoglutarate dehydrogenase complex dihydrolipoamide dehydrogenase (E3) component